ncbi:MAG: hypothetical protein COU47_00505 [Candidatus Niyogibacteria bacterium CG10_big_fil_rev_8_21_14_0_10_46_36]|uniref:CMP/dCMP-type deaminase domain-containing protein n=1 Tax=Candidatus Niyogibacteria bacterium CG10_big_fil_rev_8_21_14_0_10_46_36 TaxID=1974726 RepID=A0A2H0TED4_9BACT|nr:MAG: hypothetical protein COU47_00505 [Candidatus Niyogibacteria bacterium CG10_big_fil_rev_8_21_14_0_10_46_36]
MSKERDEKRERVFLCSILCHTPMSTCDRFHIASGIIKNKRIVGVGYNGSLPGEPHCDEAGHLMIDGHCERTNHSEENAVFNTDPKQLEGATVMIVGTPCIRCLRTLISVGIKKIICYGEYDNAKGKEFMSELKRKDIVFEQRYVDYQQLFQQLFDDMTNKGGILHRENYRLKVTKVPLDGALPKRDAGLRTKKT